MSGGNFSQTASTGGGGKSMGGDQRSQLENQINATGGGFFKTQLDGSQMPQGPQLGGGPAPIQQPQQPDIYSRYGGQQNVDSDPNRDGYQPPTGNLMQPPVAQPQPMPGAGGGKGGFGPNPQIGGGPAPLDPNMPNPLGPEGQQSTMPQQNSVGGKGGFGAQPALTQQQFENFASQLFRQ